MPINILENEVFPKTAAAAAVFIVNGLKAGLASAKTKKPGNKSRPRPRQKT